MTLTGPGEARRGEESRRGREVSLRVVLSFAMFSTDASSGAALPARRPEVGGAGSIDVYDLDVPRCSHEVAEINQ